MWSEGKLLRPFRRTIYCSSATHADAAAAAAIVAAGSKARVQLSAASGRCVHGR